MRRCSPGFCSCPLSPVRGTRKNGGEAKRGTSGALGGLLLALGLALAPAVHAAPVLGTGRQVGGLTVFRDHAKPTLWYYAPGKLVVKTASDGAPETSFMILRYTGNATTGTSGEIRYHSYLSFKVGWEAQGPKVSEALAALRRESPSAQLLPVPIQKALTGVVFTPLEGGSAKVIAGGALLEDGAPETSGPFFEKSVLLCPDEVSSEALWGILKAGAAPVALNCELKALVYDQFPKAPEGGGALPDPTLQTVATDGVSVTIDGAKYPTRLVRAELGGTAPKEYALLQLLCFDFDDGLRPDLYSKSVEIEATGVIGATLRRTIRFRAENAFASAATFKFDAAVNLKKPYRYRILTVSKTGKQTTGAWRAGKPWPVALDITSPPEEQPKLRPRRREP
jgi:hypothetical protein